MASSLNGTGLTFSSGATLNSPPVTSVATGNGLTGGPITTSGTISLDMYTGTTANNTSYPIGTYIYARQGANNINMNSSTTVYTPANTLSYTCFFGASGGSGSVAVSGTWRSRGSLIGGCGPCTFYLLLQRVA